MNCPSLFNMLGLRPLHATGMQAFDVDNKYGRYALERVYEDICGITSGPMPDVVVRSVASVLCTKHQSWLAHHNVVHVMLSRYL